MSRMRLIVAGIVVTAISACAMPMTVRQINEPDQAAKGVRYLLKRPSYKLVIVVEKKESLEQIIHETNDDPGCIEPSHAFTASLKQEIEGHPELYEVGSPHLFGQIANAFADTNLTVNVDENAHLVSVEGGAEDKSLELVTAVAGLAISLGSLAVGPFAGADEAAKKTPCFIDGPKEKKVIAKYARRHLSFLDRREILEKTLDESFSSLHMPNENEERSIKEKEKLLISIDLLRKELERLKIEIKEVGYTVPPEMYCLIYFEKEKDEGPAYLIEPRTGHITHLIDPKTGSITLLADTEIGKMSNSREDKCDTKIKVNMRRVV